MGDEFGIQLSINIPSGEQYEKGDMVNIRGRDASEFQQNLEAFNSHMAEAAARVAADVRAQYAVVQRLGGHTVQQDAAQPAQNGAGAPNGQAQAYQGQQQQSAPQNGYQQQGGYQQAPPQNQGYDQQQGYQQQQQQAPANDGGIPTSPPPHVGPAPSCSHGVKKFLAKPYKSGKPGYWMGWACPAQRNDPTQHDLEFIRQN